MRPVGYLLLLLSLAAAGVALSMGVALTDNAVSACAESDRMAEPLMFIAFSALALSWGAAAANRLRKHSPSTALDLLAMCGISASASVIVTVGLLSPFILVLVVIPPFFALLSLALIIRKVRAESAL